MITITKRLNGYPFAHRQPNHEGHCALLHGHNWDFEIELAANELDENGFVYDFGKLKWFKEWLEDNFDHTLVLNNDDPLQGSLDWAVLCDLSKVIQIPSCSCEGIAEHVFNYLELQMAERTKGRVSVVRVTVFEDYKNSATFSGSINLSFG